MHDPPGRPLAGRAAPPGPAPPPWRGRGGRSARRAPAPAARPGSTGRPRSGPLTPGHLGVARPGVEAVGQGVQPRPQAARRSAVSTSASVALGRASRTFSTSVLANTCGSSSTRPTRRRTSSRDSARTGAPPRVTRPLVGSRNRRSRAATVLFPEPDGAGQRRCARPGRGRGRAAMSGAALVPAAPRPGEARPRGVGETRSRRCRGPRARVRSRRLRRSAAARRAGRRAPASASGTATSASASGTSTSSAATGPESRCRDGGRHQQGDRRATPTPWRSRTSARADAQRAGGPPDRRGQRGLAAATVDRLRARPATSPARGACWVTSTAVDRSARTATGRLGAGGAEPGQQSPPRRPPRRPGRRPDPRRAAARR